MLLKKAIAIVDGMAQGLKDLELNKAIIALGYEIDSKDFNAIHNEYVQHAWDDEDLAGPAAPKPTVTKTKVSKKAAESDDVPATPAKKKATKKAPAGATTNADGKRVGKDGQVIVAYPKPQGRTRVMFALVLAGASNADGLAFIRKEFGKNSPTTISSLGWVRSQLRNNPDRWLHGKNGPKYGCSSKLIKGVKADKDCVTVKDLAKKVAELTAVADDESDE